MWNWPSIKNVWLTKERQNKVWAKKPAFTLSWTLLHGTVSNSLCLVLLCIDPWYKQKEWRLTYWLKKKKKNLLNLGMTLHFKILVILFSSFHEDRTLKPKITTYWHLSIRSLNQSKWAINISQGYYQSMTEGCLLTLCSMKTCHR